MDIVSLVQYSTNAQTRLYEFLADKPEALSFEVDTLSPFKTIRDLVAHITGAEQRWTPRILGHDLPPRYEDSAPTSVDALFEDWKSIRSETTGAAQSANRTELDRVILVTLQSSDVSFNLTVEQILLHIINHENFHRAQCSMLLQLQKFDPPYFDYVFEFMPH